MTAQEARDISLMMWPKNSNDDQSALSKFYRVAQGIIRKEAEKGTHECLITCEKSTAEEISDVLILLVNEGYKITVSKRFSAGFTVIISW